MKTFRQEQHFWLGECEDFNQAPTKHRRVKCDDIYMCTLGGRVSLRGCGKRGRATSVIGEERRWGGIRRKLFVPTPVKLINFTQTYLLALIMDSALSDSELVFAFLKAAGLNLLVFTHLCNSKQICSYPMCAERKWHILGCDGQHTREMINVWSWEGVLALPVPIAHCVKLIQAQEGK